MAKPTYSTCFKCYVKLDLYIKENIIKRSKIQNCDVKIEM